MKIAVLVSGGVDSSVALALLKEQGHELTAFYLKIWLEDELDFLGQCPWEDDLEVVRNVCNHLEVPLQVLSLQKEYHEKIVSYTISQVKNGFTPNPDLLCNHRIKFGAFLDKIDSSFEKIASGHYAKLVKRNENYFLMLSPDPIKDQTYFLAHLEQQQLSKIVFPLGDYPKKEIRHLAANFNLPNKDRKDSQGLCFLGKISYPDFIKHYLGEKKGDIIEWESGTKIGEHNGFWFHTIGQRRGLGLSGGPWYVTSKDSQKNIVYISNKYFSEDKQRSSFEVKNCNWLNSPPDCKQNLRVKLRHGEEFYNCKLEKINRDHYSVQIEKRDQGIAAGQFAVFYMGDECLGCAVMQ